MTAEVAFIFVFIVVIKISCCMFCIADFFSPLLKRIQEAQNCEREI